MNRVWGRESGVGYETGVDIDAPFEAVGVGKHHAIYGCPVGVGGGVSSDYVSAFALEHSPQYDNSVAGLEWKGSYWGYAAACSELPQGKLKGTHFVGGDDGVGAVGAGAGAVAPCEIADSAEEGSYVRGPATKKRDISDDRFTDVCDFIACFLCYLFKRIEDFWGYHIAVGSEDAFAHLIDFYS